MRTAALSAGACGENVAKLQVFLIQNGFVIPPPEVNRKFFGQGTRQAVRRFQQAKDLPITGSIDPQTSGAIAALALRPMHNVSPAGVSGAHGAKAQNTTISVADELSGLPSSSAKQEGLNMANGSVSSTLNNSTRRVSKATYVPMNMAALDDTVQTRGAILKFGFARQITLQPGEVDAVRSVLSSSKPLSNNGTPQAGSDIPWDTLRQFEGLPVPSQLPAPIVFATVPSAALITFGQALVALRKQRLTAISKPTTTPVGAKPATATATAITKSVGTATNLLHGATLAAAGFAKNVTATPIGWFNLERLEMTPAGIERGELLATIPLAPLEQTSVVQKEWSVTSQEFTSIVTDSLENYSETGVTENTDLSKSTTSQNQHSNQFNVNATASGGIGFVSGSIASSFSSQDSNSQSATDSAKHSIQTTRLASARVKQEHKMTISTTTVTGTSETTTRTLQNPSATDPIRIDYFSMMRKWYVALYRYGLRLTYDIAIPEPGGTLRAAYAQIDMLQKAISQQFIFPYKHSDISTDVHQGDSEPYYLVLADKYSVDVPPPPGQPAVLNVNVGFSHNGDFPPHGTSFTVPDNYWITNIYYSDWHLSNVTPITLLVDFAGSPNNVLSAGNSQNGAQPGVDLCSNQGFLYHQSGQQSITVFYDTGDTPGGSLSFNVVCAPTDTSMAQWQSAVWTALYNAAQTAFYSQQQAISAQIQALQSKLNNVDTLTLRREENDEIMKGVLRWLLGPSFDFMPQEVASLFGGASSNSCPPNNAPTGCDLLTHGVSFTGNDLFTNNPNLQQANTDWSTMFQYEEMVKFINEAIEWENVAYFLYSYFWDVPASWDFIRQIQHPDAIRQAFLRSGSARVVLTVRKGWETAFVNFVEAGGFSQTLLPLDHPYMSIAQEIQAYDETNYPGIPSANPGGSAPPDDDQYAATTCTNIANGTGSVILTVASTDGFLVGYTAIIDTWDPTTWDPVTGQQNLQETQVITGVDVANSTISVAVLTNSHITPFNIIQAGEKGQLIAEWFEYTPTSGTDIAVTSNLATIA